MSERLTPEQRWARTQGTPVFVHEDGTLEDGTRAIDVYPELKLPTDTLDRVLADARVPHLARGGFLSTDCAQCRPAISAAIARAISDAEAAARERALEECIAFGALMEEYCETGDPTYDSGQQAAITEYQNKIRALKSSSDS